MPVGYPLDCILKSVLVIAAIAALTYRGAAPFASRLRVLLALAAISVLAYPIATFAARGTSVHAWEQFHYVLGAKYFDELGYEGLYEAALVASETAVPAMVPRYVRDLATNDVVSATSVHERAEARLAAFSPARRDAFVADVGALLGGMSREEVARVFLDHGYNASPVFTVVAQLFTRVIPVSEGGLRVFASLDVVLLALLFVVLARTFGRGALALSILVFATSLGWHFGWTGGAFLRNDWLVAIGLGLCALSRERFVLAGALFAYAAAVRLFPAAFLVAALVPLVHAARTGKGSTSLVRFVGAFALALGLFAVLGGASGRGFAAYPEFASRLSTHRALWLANDVGFSSATIADQVRANRELIDPSAPGPSEAWARAVSVARENRKPFVLAVALLVAAWVASRIREKKPHEAAVFGLVLVYFLSAPANYYWVMWLFLPLVAPAGVVASLLGTTLLLAVIEAIGVKSDGSRFVTFSFALLFVIGDWLFSLRAPTAIAATGPIDTMPAMRTAETPFEA